LVQEIEAPTEAPTTLDEGFKGAAEVTTTEPPPSTEPPVTAGQDEGKEGPSTPASWEDLEQTEWFPAALEERRAQLLEEAKPGILKEAKREAFREFDPSMQRRESLVKETSELATRAYNSLIRMARDNGDTAALQNFADDNPQLWRALNGSVFQEGTDWGLRQLARVSGDPNVLPELYLRLQNENLSDEQFATEFLDRLAESRSTTRIKDAVEKATAPKDKEIAQLKATIEKMKATTRSQEGPNTAQSTGGGGGKPYSQMNREERAALSPEERDAAVAREMRG